MSLDFWRVRELANSAPIAQPIMIREALLTTRELLLRLKVETEIALLKTDEAINQKNEEVEP